MSLSYLRFGLPSAARRAAEDKLKTLQIAALR
jgi:hypothetical protein